MSTASPDNRAPRHGAPLLHFVEQPPRVRRVPAATARSSGSGRPGIHTAPQARAAEQGRLGVVGDLGAEREDDGEGRERVGPRRRGAGAGAPAASPT
jgi:hypothetical protein